MRSNTSEIKTGNVNEHDRKPVVIRNRDIPALADVLAVMQMIGKTEELRQWQREKMTNITSRLTGMPGGHGAAVGFEETLAALSEIDERQNQNCAEYAEKLRRAEEILNGISSISMRAFVMMKYVLDVPDIEIRRELNMSLRRFYGARRCIEDAANMAGVKWSERYMVRRE